MAIPQDFNRKITINKLKNFILKNNINILGIDGITYLTDERYKPGDSRTTMLTNISEDLMSLSIELKIPIIVVVQSNRSGVNKETEDTPDLENIKDSDGIGANATKVIAIRQKLDDNSIQLSIRKHRDGRTGQTLSYRVDFDVGSFSYLQSINDGIKSNKEISINTNKEQSKIDDSAMF